MKDSIKLMQIYRSYLETTGELVELLESHCQTVSDNNISDNLKNKYKEFRTHAQNLTRTLDNDLHVLLRLDAELKEIENLEDKK
jgi:hypothetical protein